MAIDAIGDALSRGASALTGGSGGDSAGAAMVGAVGDFLTNRYSARHAQSFSREMANTQYTRAVRDLKNAGLNPILAARVGGNAAPQGVQMHGIGLGQSLSSAKQAEASMIQAESTESLQTEMEDKVRAEVKNIGMQTNLTEAQISLTAKLARKAYFEANLAEAQTTGKELENNVNAVIEEFKTDNPNITLLQEFGLDASSLKDVIMAVISKRGGGSKQ